MRRQFFGRLLLVMAASLAAPALAQTSLDTVVEVTATAQKVPTPKITLAWPSNANATGFTVYRKAVPSTTWGSPVATLPGSSTGWADTSVAVGSTYEYWVSASTTLTPANGYLVSGIEAPLVESRGKVVLLVDATFTSSLSTELARLEQDLVGDGWTVLRHDVARSDTPPNVKALIQLEYARDPANVQAVFLFGHVPVPYAGALAPDGHGNHYGAWPADIYYGDVDGVWTDTQNYDSTVAGRQHNVAGDGKFDQTYSPSPVDLEVGRVDLSNMPAFAPKTELDLLRQYLNKDHNFRHKLISAQPRGLIDDNFGYFGGEAFASTGWRSFSSFFGPANVQALDWFTTLATQSYLWAYGCGGGSFTGAGGVGSTSNFASTDTQVIFTILFGSYFGDWDVGNNFLRAPLATTTYGLTDAWAGRPPWYFHHMAMGEPIGYSARLTQNNSGTYWSGYGPLVSIALMGDPTLRMHVVAPPSNLSATPLAGNVTLSWTASPDAVLGYDVYRSSSPKGPFLRLNGALVAAPTFADTAVSSLAAGTYTYMVRAVRLETSASGTYFNASQGVFVDAAAGSGAAAADLEALVSAAPTPAVVGSNVAYTISLGNHGPADATGVALTHTVPAGLTFVSVTPSAGCSFGSGQVTCTVGALPRGAEASYSVVVTGISAGTRTAATHVSGVQSDPNTANNSASTSVDIVSSAATATLLSSSSNPATVGTSVTLTATVTSAAGGTPTGSVTFKDAAVTLGTGSVGAGGQATFTTSSLTIGTHPITAVYSGDSHFNTSTSAAMSQSITGPSSTAIASSRNPSVAGQTVTFTATVTSSFGTPTGTVSFNDGGSSIGSASLDAAGHASFTTSSLAAGAHSMTAAYFGGGGFNPSTSPALTQTVNAATGATTTTALVSSLNPSILGQSVTFTATVSSATSGTPSGSVTFIFGSTFLGTAALNGSAQASLTTSTLPAGVLGMRATYEGDSTFKPSTSSILTQRVKDTVTVTLASSPSPSSPGQQVTFTATITPTPPAPTYPSGTVTFSEGSTTLGTAPVFYPGTAVFRTSSLSIGSHSITATYGGDLNFAGGVSSPLTHVVTGPLSFYTVTPCRVVDTRGPSGPLGAPALAAGADRTFTLTGHCGIPSTARAVAANVAVTQPSSGPGFLTLFPGGTTRPVASTINYNAGKTRANNAILQLGSAGDVTVHCRQATGTAQLTLDVNGYFQ